MSAVIGTFNACYEISTGLAGAPNLRLNLVVTTPTEKVNGSAEITQTTNPVFNAHYDVSGNFAYMTVMPNNTSIMVKLTGITGPQFGLVNFEAYLVLNDDWKSGTANFRYLGQNAQWIDIKDAKVKSLPCQGL